MTNPPPLWLLYVFVSMMVIGMICTIIGFMMEVFGG